MMICYPVRTLGLALILTVILPGCGKNEKHAPAGIASSSVSENSAVSAGGRPTATPEPQPQGQADIKPRQGSTAPVTPIVINESAEVGVVLEQLTQAVRKYSFEQRRMPKTLEEVQSAGYLSAMPPAPAGKKFALDSKAVEVVLVKR